MFNNSQHACTSDPRRVMTPSPSHPSEVQVHDLTHPTPARATTGLLWPSHLCGQQGRATRFIYLCGTSACSVPPRSASKARETCHSAGPSASPLYLRCTSELLQLLLHRCRVGRRCNCCHTRLCDVGLRRRQGAAWRRPRLHLLCPCSTLLAQLLRRATQPPRTLH